MQGLGAETRLSVYADSKPGRVARSGLGGLGPRLSSDRGYGTVRCFAPDGVRDDGMWIKTSMVRDDTGAGACEVLLVSDVAFPLR